MSIRKTILSALSLFLFMSCLSAQNTNSPYSRFGYGSLENPALGKSRAMGGIGYGIRDKSMINPMNPASYSSVDTLNFLFDFGVSASCSFFKENGLHQINPNGRFDYMAMKIPLKRNWGMAFGLMPYSNVGYTYSIKEKTEYEAIDVTKTYTGTGGLNTLFLGTGISLGKHLSLGANLKYVFGTITYAGSVVYPDGEGTSYYPSENWYLGAPSLDLGIQYQMKIGKKGQAIVGATYTNATAFALNDVYHVKLVPGIDTLENTSHEAFDLPNTLGIGVSYTYDNRLTVGLDYQGQAWSKSSFYGVKDTLANNTRLALGVEYLPSLMATSYFNAIKYRFGMQITDSYLDFPEGNVKNAGITLGFGLPLKSQKSSLNFSFEAGKLITPDASFVSENYYKVSLSVAFNELWFFKRKL